LPISLIIVHYDTRAALERLLRSLREAEAGALRECSS